jgi:hypothetical protein
MADAREKCTIRDGRFVEPCDMLDKMSEFGNPPKGKSRGIYAWAYTNTRTHQPSRTFFGAKSTTQPNGMAFNFCPWCGERIDAPLLMATGDKEQSNG